VAVLMLQLDPSDPPGRLGQWLADAGVEVDLRMAADDGGLPADLRGHDGLVVLGGGMGATDDVRWPWLAAIRALLRAAVADEVPTLALCLGAQLLAVAHGGRVEPNPDGPEIGAQLIAKRTSAAPDPLFGPLPIAPDVIQWHYDAVTRLPAGAVQLASSPLCEQQAFRLGRLAWGIQFHIETTPDVVREWAREDADRLEGYDLDLILSRADAVHDDLAEVWPGFVRAFAEVLRDPGAVAPLRTAPTSIAAPITDPAGIRAALAAELQASRATPPMPVLPMPTRRPPDDD
jgi:GMP synthase-like glutamine amidotransferase